VQSQGGAKSPYCRWDAAYAAAIDMGCAEGSRGATVPEFEQGRRREIYRFYGIEFCISRDERDREKGKCRTVCSKAAAGATAAAVEVSACATAGTTAEGVSAAKGSAQISGWSLWCPCDGFESNTSNTARR
jgi:hypothetical protein